LYKRMFVPEIQPPTLVVIGYHDEIASIANTSEMQARYSTRVLKVSFLQITTLYMPITSAVVYKSLISHKSVRMVVNIKQFVLVAGQSLLLHTRKTKY